MSTEEYMNAEAELCMELIYNPKAVKVTDGFLQYLENEYINKMELYLFRNTLDEGTSYKFMGFPLILDDTIDNPYYEVIY